MKKILNFWPLLIILGIWIVFAVPYFLKNASPFPSTYQVSAFAPSSAYGTHGPVKNGAMPDLIDQIYPWKKLVIDQWKEGVVPLWNPYSFSGTPLLANYQSAVLSPFNLLFFIFTFVNAWTILVLLQPLLAGVFTYLFTKSLKQSNLGSIIASLSFMFCGFITCWMGYATLGYAILFLPLGLFAIEKFIQLKKIRYLILFSISFPLSFFSGHFQISLYFLLFIFSYIIFVFIKTKSFKTSSWLIMFLILGILLCAPQLLPSLEFYSQSFRSGLFQKTEAIPWGYLPTFISPDFFGNSVTRNDWFGHYAEWNGYIGLIGLLFAVFALFSKWTKEIWFFCIMGVLSLLLAFDSPLLDLLVSLHVPVLSTSAASRIIVLFSFSFSVLAGYGATHLLKDIEKKKLKKIASLFVVSIIFFIALWSIVVFKLFLPIDKIQIAKSNLRLPTIIFIVFFISIFSLFFVRGKKYMVAALAFIIFLAAFDMFRFTTKWQPFDPKGLVFEDVSISSALKTIPITSRAYGEYGAELSNYYHVSSVEGYDALYIHRYGQFMASLSDGKLSDSARSVVSFPKFGAYTPQALNFLGIDFLIHKVSDDHAPWTFPYWNYPTTQVYQDAGYQIFKNTNAYPRAYLVGSYRVDTGEQNILNDMFRKNTDLKNTVVLESDPHIVTAQNSGTVSINSYQSTKISLSSTSSSNSLLVLTDPYYPGWKAYVDGKKTAILRADFAFRAVALPAGNHTIVFQYEPESFKMGVILFGFGLLGMGVISFLYKKKYNE